MNNIHGGLMASFRQESKIIINRDEDRLAKIDLRDVKGILKALIFPMKSGNVLKFEKIYEIVPTTTIDSLLDERKNTILHIACRYSSVDIVHFLASKNSKLICQENTDGNTPLHIAYYWGKIDVVEVLNSFDEGHYAEEVPNKRGYLPRKMWIHDSKDSCIRNPQTMWINDLKDYCDGNPPQLSTAEFTDEEREGFDRERRSVTSKYLRLYRDDFMPRSLLNGSLYSTVQTFWLTTTYYKNTSSLVGLNEIVGQLLYWFMLLISYFQLRSIEYLGENVYDAHPSAQLNLQEVYTNQQYHEWLFDLFVRYFTPVTNQTFSFDEILTSIMRIAKFSFGPQQTNIRVNEATFRLSIAWKFRGVLSANLFPVLVNAALPSSDMRSSFQLVKLIMDSGIDDKRFLKELCNCFQELSHYQQLVDFSPDLSGHAKTPNPELLVALFGESAANKLHPNLVTEGNKLLLRLLYVRDIIRGDKSRFPRLSQKEFDELRYFILPSIDTEERLHYLLFCIVMDDLGRTKPIIDEVSGSHGSYLRTYFKNMQSNSLLISKVPSYQRLAPFYRKLYFQHISSSFSLGAFVQGESVPYSLYEFYISSPLIYSRKYRLIVQFIAFSSFNHSYDFESLGLDDAVCRQYLLAATMILQSEIRGLDLPAANCQIYERYLIERARVVQVNFETLNLLSKEERFALFRIIALARASTHEEWLEILEVWKVFPTILKSELVEYLNYTGFTGKTAIYIYYAPAILANSVRSFSSDATPRAEDGTSQASCFQIGLFYGLQELIAIYQDGERRIGDTTSGGVYIYDALVHAEKMREISTILRSAGGRSSFSPYVLMEGHYEATERK